MLPCWPARHVAADRSVSGGASGRAAKAEVWAVFKIGDDVVVDRQSELEEP